MKNRNADSKMLLSDVQCAYQIGNMYFAIQTSDEGYDYTFYDEDYVDEDGGTYDDSTVSISEAIKDIFAEEGYSLDDAKEIDYEDLMASIEEVEDQQMREIETKYWLQKNEQPDLVRRLVLFANGMSNDFFLIVTDAPKKYIEKYCKWHNTWMEDGGQGDFLEPLRKKYYVNLLIDSETSDREELEAIIDGKTVESYDFFCYWDDK